MDNPIRIKIVGDKTMGCSGCEGNVEFSLAQLAEVDEARANRETQEVEIFLHSDVDFDAIRHEMSELGYAIETV
jgi:copper chaperone CopZ